jgi:hypothetical protein
MVFENLAAGNALPGPVAMGAIDIANRGDFRVSAGSDLYGKIGSTGAVADDAQPYPVIGSSHRAWNGESAQAGGDLAQEPSSRTHVLIITALELTASMITADAGSESMIFQLPQLFPVGKNNIVPFV